MAFSKNAVVMNNVSGTQYPMEDISTIFVALDSVNGRTEPKRFTFVSTVEQFPTLQHVA